MREVEEHWCVDDIMQCVDAMQVKAELAKIQTETPKEGN